MTLDAKEFRDPSLTVRYEMERQPCYGCAHIGHLLGKKYCVKGFKMEKKCRLWRKKNGVSMY